MEQLEDSGIHRRKDQEFQSAGKKSLDYAKGFEYDIDLFFNALVESTDDYIYIGDLRTGTFRYSSAMIAEFDLPGEIVPDAAKAWGYLVHPDDKEDFLKANQEIADGLTEGHNIEYRAVNRQGDWVWLRCRGHVARDKEGKPAIFAGMITNLGKKNNVDHVTGLYKKYELEEEIHRLIRNYPQLSFGIMLLDIDDFRHINDLYDRMFGDEVIRITAQGIRSILPEGATVYRMDGDEFCILYRTDRESEYQALFNKIQQEFQYQQEYNGCKFYCAVSAGCSLYPADGDNYLTLIKFANYSLEYSKGNGKNQMTMFAGDIMNCKERMLYLTELLRESIEHDFEGFFLNYQPQVEAETGRLVGAEALTRWSCEKYGVISPMEFISILEQNNLIIRVGRWILHEAVKQCGQWLLKEPDFKMSINLSYLQVIDPDFTTFFQNLTKEMGVPFKSITLELTETYLIKEQAYVSQIFEALRYMGVGVAMDDFGTGYSSLGVLKDIPIDIVKIDQAFVRGLQQGDQDTTFIRFAVALCHDVGKEVCLEGVETNEEYNIVKASGLEYIQGYYFGRPVSAEEFEKKYLT